MLCPQNLANVSINEGFKKDFWGTRVAKLVGCPTLDLSSGLDLGVMGLSLALGFTLHMEPTEKKKNDQIITEK